MDAKWIPVIAASLGVIGGVGGAIVGGALTNAGQEQQIESEREAAEEDLRRVTYAQFLAAADAVATQWAVAKEEWSQERKLEFVQPAVIELFKNRGALELLADAELALAVSRMVEDLTSGGKEWTARRADYLLLARKEIESRE